MSPSPGVEGVIPRHRYNLYIGSICGKPNRRKGVVQAFQLAQNTACVAGRGCESAHAALEIRLAVRRPDRNAASVLSHHRANEARLHG